MRNRVILFLCIVLCFTTIAVAEEADDNVPPPKEQIFRVYDDITLSSSIDFFYGKPKIVVKAVYPQLTSENGNPNVVDFNNLVYEFIQQQVTEFKNQVKLTTIDTADVPDAAIANGNRLYIDYAASVVGAKNDHIVSIRFNLQSYMAGQAHPTNKHHVINFNLDTDDEVDLSDLFAENTNYLEVMSSYTSRYLSKRLPQKNIIQDGMAPTADHFTLWNFKPNGILITFDEAQVASSVYGAQSVLIPYATLKDLIAADAPLASCIKRKKNCVRDHLVTGGFIDEADNSALINSHHRRLYPILSQR
jgi:hypothetical protein